MKGAIVATAAVCASTVAMTAQTMGSYPAFMVAGLLISPFVGIAGAIYITKNVD